VVTGVDGHNTTESDIKETFSVNLLVKTLH